MLAHLILTYINSLCLIKKGKAKSLFSKDLKTEFYFFYYPRWSGGLWIKEITSFDFHADKLAGLSMPHLFVTFLKNLFC